ncbi:MAG: NAD(P)H-quinone oxidoreductase [Alphaproteobacteria bacterium]
MAGIGGGNLLGTLNAIEISTPGDAEVLRLVQRPIPQPNAGEVLIEVAAAGVNRPDILQRKGGYPPPAGITDIPGLEVAGTIAAIGDGITKWKIGDPVCALVAGGGYATHCIAPAPQCLPIPQGLSMIEAAAVPETFFTVWTNVFERGGLKANDILLVHGGSSGIGTTAIQLGVAFGAKVFATAGSAEKCQACEHLGATRGINYRHEDFVAIIKEATDNYGADVILDMVGGDTLPEISPPPLWVGGVQIAFLHGSTLSIWLHFMLKRLIYTGSTLRPRFSNGKSWLSPMLCMKKVVSAGERPGQTLYRLCFLAEAAAAHRRMESGQRYWQDRVGGSARAAEIPVYWRLRTAALAEGQTPLIRGTSKEIPCGGE